MLADGRKIADIAEVLHLSPKTVATYKYRIFEKAGHAQRCRHDPHGHALRGGGFGLRLTVRRPTCGRRSIRNPRSYGAGRLAAIEPVRRRSRLRRDWFFGRRSAFSGAGGFQGIDALVVLDHLDQRSRELRDDSGAAGPAAPRVPALSRLVSLRGPVRARLAVRAFGSLLALLVVFGIGPLLVRCLVPDVWYGERRRRPFRAELSVLLVPNRRPFARRFCASPGLLAGCCGGLSSA